MSHAEIIAQLNTPAHTRSGTVNLTIRELDMSYEVSETLEDLIHALKQDFESGTATNNYVLRVKKSLCYGDHVYKPLETTIKGATGTFSIVSPRTDNNGCGYLVIRRIFRL